MLKIPIASAMLAILASCSSATGDRPERDDADPTPTDAPRARPSPTLPHGSLSIKPSPAASLAGTLTGVLGMAEIETGCPYLQAEDGTRYEVIYPDGWELRRGPLELISPEGEVVARAGDEVTVRGSPAADMASFCMIGPIFRADEVLSSP